jgi:hypothetical protein
VRHLAGLTQLLSLNLAYSRVADSGLHYLAGLTELSWLWVNEAGVTEAGGRPAAAGAAGLRVSHS